MRKNREQVIIHSRTKHFLQERQRWGKQFSKWSSWKSQR